MRIEGQIGRKIQTRTEIAHKEREKQKLLRMWRKQNRKRAKRTQADKIIVKRLKKIETIRRINERPYVSLESGISLYKEISEALCLMGFPNNHASGAIRRKLKKIMTINIVIESYYPPSLNLFSEQFTQKMAEVGYICNYMHMNKMSPGISQTRYRFNLDGLYVLFHFCSPEKLGAYLLYTTGNELFWRRLVWYCADEGSILRKDGLYAAGELLESKKEQDMFSLVNLDHIPPESRSFGSTDKIRTFEKIKFDICKL